ncbi:MAG TPA: hypothetical protein VMT00_16175 [Thermoanaerobaculia bacterium]|nr:hypothetical protein [Thermoanaerobaculia bacterium]
MTMLRRRNVTEIERLHRRFLPWLAEGGWIDSWMRERLWDDLWKLIEDARRRP